MVSGKPGAVQTASGATATIGTTAATSTYGMGTGATTTGVTKTVNLGTGGASGSTTVVNIGSAIWSVADKRGR